MPDVQTLADPVRAEVELLIAEARAGANWSYDKDDPQGLDVALAIAAEVRKRSPRTINAYYRPTRWLLRARRPDAARELVQRGIELAPHLDPLVELYWDAILSSNAFSPEQRRAAIRPEIERRLQARPGDPDLLFTAATYYGRLGLDDERERLFERIERDFSGSRAEESVAWARIDAQSELVSEQSRDQDETDPKARQELADMYRAMIARPRHHLTRWVGRAYTGLFMALRSQDDVDSDELLRLVEGMVEHDPHNPHIKYGMGPRMLAEKTDHDERALEIVELGLAEANAELAEAEDAAEKKPAKGSRARAESARKRLGFLLMEKAGVLAAMERFDEAQAALDAAEPHLGPYAERLLRAGQLAERRGRLDEAERCYADGLALPWHGETHPCREALQALYVERNGSERGLRRYMKRVEAEQRARRKADVLAERIEETRPMSAFSLTDLGGERLDSRDLAGRSPWCTFGRCGAVGAWPRLPGGPNSSGATQTIVTSSS